MATIYRYHLLDIHPITRELARSEMIDTMQDPVIVVDTDDRIIDVNTAVERMNDTTKKAVVGRSIAQVYPTIADILDDTADDQANQRDIKHTYNGTERYFDVQVTPLSRGFGALSGRLISLRDVTARRHREQRLDVLNRLLRHNFRNVLTTIQGNAEYVENEYDDEEIQRRMKVIMENAETVIERRDKFDKVIRTLDHDELTPVDTGMEIKKIVSDIQTKFPDAEITVDGTGETWVNGGTVFQIAIEELLTNAIKHNDRRNPTVHVHVDVEQRNESFVRIDIEDDGPGIPAHEVEPIIAGEETPLKHSSGVGLWLVNWIVDSVGGQMSFGVLDDGTRVTVLIPLMNRSTSTTSS